VGYGRHATHRLSPASRDSSRLPGRAKRFRASVENFFFREVNPLSFPVLLSGGILSLEDQSIPKIFDFPRPFEILLGDVRLDGWTGFMDCRGLT